jgi:hypothetical protein
MAVRWALTMAAVVVITMTVTATILYKQQYAAMMDQVKDYGGSLAKFTATQMAVPLLSEDWAAMDVFVQEALGRQENFSYMSVVDYEGVVRASNVAAQVNQKYAAAAGTPVSSQDPQVTCKAHKMPDGRQVLDFAGARAVPGKDHRRRPPRHLRGAAHRRRQSRARAARDPHVRHRRSGGRRHVPPGAAPVDARARAEELARGGSPTAVSTTASPRRARTSSASSTRNSTRRRAALERRYEEPPAPSTLSKHLTEGL